MKKCLDCSGDFLQSRYGNYCSYKCYNNHPKRPKGISVIKECIICKSEFKVWKSHSNLLKCCKNDSCKKIHRKNIQKSIGEKNKVEKIKKICQICNYEFYVLPCFNNRILCSKKCQLKFRAIKGAQGNKSISKPQLIIYEFLKEIFNDAILCDVSILKFQEIDIFIPSLNLAIEVQGRVHYEPIFGLKTFQRVQKNDKTKRTLLKNKNIMLLEIKVERESKESLILKTLEILKVSGIAVQKL